jgi:oxazoline/thiazoline synthase
MSYRPQFKRCFRWALVPSEGVILQSERGPLLLRGLVYFRLAPLLDGQHTVDEIIACLQGQVSAVEVLYALKLLHHRGYVVDVTPSVPSEQAAFWDLLDVDPRDAIKRLQETTVSVVAFGAIDPAPFHATLASLGTQVGDDGQYCVVLTDDYLRDELDAFNQESLAYDRPWLLVKPLGTELWIGPLFLPGKTGCWACLAHRLRGARKVESFLREKVSAPASSSSLSLAVLPSTLYTALNIAATETAKWIVCGQNEGLEGQVVTLNVLSLAKHNHVLVRRLQCPCCGDPSAFTASQSASLVLQSRKKSFTSDGGHRGFAPEETLKTLEYHISPITGIVSTLQPLSEWVGEKSLTPSFVTAHNFVIAPKEDSLDLDFLSASLRGGSGGKGRYPTQAKVSALCEAIERYSGIFQGDEARVRARLKDLGAAAIHPNACMLYSERQFGNRAQWNARGSRSTWVPEPFNADVEVEWSSVWSLTYDEPRYVPTAYCYYGYSRKYNAWFARADSNGCAAGRSKEEAILQGFMEVVERDNIALWWYNRLQKPAVDIHSFTEPYFQELQAYYQTLHRDLWVLDITSDVPIPTFAAISRRNDREVEDIILGFGAHFDPRLAVLRALTEVNQWLPVICSSTPDKGETYLYHDPEATSWWKTATLENHSYLAPNEIAAPKVKADYPWCWSDDLTTDVMTCVRIAEAKGLETLVLDQTRPDTGLHVVKVFVPGLRHFWPRFGSGRLYDVPVQMGWLRESLTEDQLNPRHIFF